MTKKEMKRAKAKIKKFVESNDVIIDRNGCKLIVPKNGDSEEAKKWMKQVEDSCEIYAIDNCGFLYKECDVVSINDNGFMTTFMVKNHNNPNDSEKAFICLTSVIDKMKSIIHEVNFSSLDAMKKNLLPTFNGPDGACFIGKPLDGVTIGFKFTIPNVKSF